MAGDDETKDALEAKKPRFRKPKPLTDNEVRLNSAIIRGHTDEIERLRVLVDLERKA
jgi:hypothetical protein